jgi:hypothetical protein
MSSQLYLQQENRTTNEPRFHPLIRKSFIFIQSAGMRLAPEVLILELMREVFFERHYGECTATKYIDPDECDDERRHIMTEKQRAVLYTLGGRSTRNKTRFYAPAYPILATRGWLGKNRERVINGFLLSGPIAQCLWDRGPNTEDGKAKQQDIVSLVFDALLGKKSCIDETFDGKDFLAATLGPEGFATDRDIALNNLISKTEYSDSVMHGVHDELATRITKDFITICEIEGEIPRMQWLQLLMTFLRFALPMWLLAQMQTTKLLHNWLLLAADNGIVVDNTAIKAALSTRNKGLLHPTLTATRELFEQIECYMKNRVEVNILLYCLEQARPEQIKDMRLTLCGAGSEVLSLYTLLALVKDAAADIRNSDRFNAIAKGLSIQTFLTREGEQFSAWRNPLTKGQGKNIDEFFRVQYRADRGDDEGFLLTHEVQRTKQGFRVFPGQLLLKTVTYLAAKDKWSDQPSRGAGKLVLQDVEELFDQYGVDFSAAADARPLLMSELKAMGLLTGSPDAGSSVAIACPY